MPENFSVRSYKGDYQVRFDDDLEALVKRFATTDSHWLVDANVARAHGGALRGPLSAATTIVVDATEEAKSIEKIIGIMHRLVEHKLRRNQRLVAVGGGIVQDITCFIASTMLRGVDWKFLPTTLLAQADSCIGSKSSVNLGTVKNILGTFNPPSEIAICGLFLDTLEQKDIRSGIGEIIKVHAIDSAAAFDRLAQDYDTLSADRAVLIHYIEQALKIKKRYIEIDEFDQGVRNIFNYGHSFGHAIESATDFAVPHGIAVTMGMQIANSVAAQRGLITESQRTRMQPLLKKNIGAFATTQIPFDAMLSALTKDKKNTASQLVVILPVGKDAAIQKVPLDNDPTFRSQLQAALAGMRQ